MSLKQQVGHACQAADTGTVSALKNSLMEKGDALRNIRDQYERTLLHASVEEGQHQITKILLSIGLTQMFKKAVGQHLLFLQFLKTISQFAKRS